MDLLTAGRIDLIIGIIVRKLQMNLNLIRVSAWGKVLLTGIFVLSVLLFKPKGVFSAWQETRPVWMGGFTAIIIGAIVALALNDSGIVAAGTMIVYAAAPILLLVSEEEQAHLSRRE
jgi:drug/metabolite transporter (DMT)-like permease